MREVAVSPSNPVLIDMSAAAAALGDLTATSAATNTLAVPGLAIGFAAATALAEDPLPLTAAETAGFVTPGTIMSGHTVRLSIDFPDGPSPVSFDASATYVSVHSGGNILGGYDPLPDASSLSLHYGSF
jgi:hypothetical protein